MIRTPGLPPPRLIPRPTAGPRSRRWAIRLLPGLLLGALLLIALALRPGPAAATGAVSCASGTGGTWTAGEVSVYWFDVEQGDSQLIVGPTGKTLLIDLGETSFNTTGTSTKAYAVAAKIRAVCGTGSNPVALDYVLVSHHHLDHIGYAGNPADTTSYGNGLYQLLTPGGLGFTVGTFLDRDGGTWTDTNSNGVCEVGTSTNPSTEIAWHNAGTTSQTSRRLICWLYGTAGQADRANIEGHVTTLTNSSAWPSINLGTGVTATIVNANGKDTMQADGITPVSGDHTTQGGSGPPSENDYSTALEVRYGAWKYATAGDSDGEYNTSVNGYTYNNIEAKLSTLFGDVDTMRANHHGSDHSSSGSYLNALKPESVFVSCGNNSFGHPGNRMLNALRALVNDRGTGSDIYLANNPCDTTQSDGTTLTDYTGTFNHNGDVVLHTTSSGAGYTITYDSGTNTYTAYGSGPTPTVTPTATATATATATNTPGAGTNHLVISQIYGGGGNSSAAYQNDFIELHNSSGSAITISGWSVQYAAAGSNFSASTAINATIPAGGYFLVKEASGGATGAVLPTADATGSINLSASAGKVALVNSTTLLTCGGTGNRCTGVAAIVDLVGYGASASDYEGSGPAPASSNNTYSVARKSNGCTETDDNAADFQTLTPANPRNSASAVYTCAAPPTATPTNTPTATPTNTPTNTPTATPTNTPTNTPTPAGPSSVVINEYLMAPQTLYSTEWIELYNPTSNAIDLSGLYLDDVAAGGGTPKQIPASTTIASHGTYVMTFASGFLNNTGSDSVRFLSITGGVETVYDSTSYSLGSTQYDKVFHRQGDGGAWCGTISTNVTQGSANPNTCP